MGYAGQISLGQAGFFAIGGYTAAFLSTVDLSAAGVAPGHRAGSPGSGSWSARPDLYGGRRWG